MNRIKFEAKALRLLSEDFDYLQNSIEENDAKILRSFLEFPGIKGILRGYHVGIDPNNPNRIRVYHQYGYAVTSTGVLIESFTSTGGIELSDQSDGVENFVFLSYRQLDGSYDYSTNRVIVGERKALDYADYTLKYNRSVDSYEYFVYTDSEYDALSEEEKKNLICLGSAIAGGIDQPIRQVTTNRREDIRMYLPERTILVENLDPNIQIPQTYVDTSQTIDDNYFGVSSTLQDDLNRIRTEIRYIKGTPTWDTFTPANLATFDATINRLHPNGVLQWAEDFGFTITSSGRVITINRGKINIDGYVYSILSSTGVSFPIVLPQLYQVGNLSTRTGYESYYVGDPPQEVTLQNKNIRDVYIFDASNIYGNPYILGTDYTLDTSSGKIFTIVGGNILNETIAVFYKWGYWRCDAIDVLSNGDLIYVVGTPAENPVPPPMTSTGAIRLYLIRISPLRDYITEDDVFNVKQYSQPCEPLGFLSADHVLNLRDHEVRSSDISYYPNWLVITTSTGDVVPQTSGWSLSSTGGYVFIEITPDYEIRGCFYTQEDSEFSIQYLPVWNVDSIIRILFESIPNSGVFDKTFDVPIKRMVTTSPLPFTYRVPFVTTKGYHRFRIRLLSGSVFRLVKLIVGKLERSLVYDSELFDYLIYSREPLFIEYFDIDYGSGISYVQLGQNFVPSFPATGSPSGTVEFVALHSVYPISLFLVYSMGSSESNKVVRLVLEFYVDGLLADTIVRELSVVNNQNRANYMLQNVLDNSKFSYNSNIVVRFIRDNTVANNHNGSFNLIDVGVL